MAIPRKPKSHGIFTDIKAAEIERELLRRELIKRKVVDLDFVGKHCFAAQRAFVQSPTRAKVAFCTRRAGKSEGAALYLIQEARNWPGSTCLYLAKTRKSAKSILWRLLIKWLERLNIPHELNRTELTVTLENDAIIMLSGVDTTMEERSKFLGLPQLRLAIIDECQAHRVDLYPLVVSTLQPGLIDVGGTLCLLGTPGNFATGLYYRLTENKREETDPIFEVHKWTAYDNPYMSEQWTKEIEDIKLRTPARLETPEFLQDYLGRWSVDDGRRVYKFKDGRNTFTELPKVNRWSVILGVDLGYEDDTAFSVLLYSKDDTASYVIYCYKEKHMLITDVVTKLRKLIAKFAPDVMVCDMASKQAVMEMVVRHGIPLIAADKTGKSDFIELMNHDLIIGTIRLAAKDMDLEVNGMRMLAEGTDALINEWGTLIWADPTPGQVARKEHPGCSNHLADATYYAWRYTHSHLGAKPIPEIRPGSPEWFAREQVLMLENLTKRRDDAERVKEAEDWGWAPPPGDDWSSTELLN